MGDTSAESQPLGDVSNRSTGLRTNDRQSLDPAIHHDREGRSNSYGGAQYTQPYSPQRASPGRQDVFNMNSMGHAMSDLSYSNYGAPSHGFSAGPSPPLQYQMQNQQFGGPTNMNQNVQNMPYNMQYQAHYQGLYSPNLNQGVPNIGPGIGMGNQYYQGQPFMGQPQQSAAPFFVQPTQHRGQNQTFSAGQPQGQPSLRNTFAGDMRQGNGYLATNSLQASSMQSGNAASSASQSSVVRGPPRKPRQSGHAIWIGNLPPHTDLMSLVLHVCKETLGLESLFLISKSNCAFANFKDEAACAAAQIKIHDSRFQTVRLVSRLRRSSIGTAKAMPTGPAALSPPSVPVAASTTPINDEHSTLETDDEVEIVQQSEDTTQPRDKYFVVKSLTVEDLELSVRNGIWATQSHNENSLNQAYKNADNVYLIFSANKSGEYFGYAKMISPINDDPAAAIEFAPKAHTVEDPELPKAIPTSATEFAPNGRIIDDSARGTIFWEAEREDMVEGEVDEGDETRSEEESGKKAWGKPFKIEWISTTRLPFYRTRGLRNPWNSNREVKIARDGTELETNVGQRLVGLFHRAPTPVAPLLPGGPMISGYPPMRPFP